MRVNDASFLTAEWIGSPVIVVFLDHTEDALSLAIIEVVGKLIDIKQEFIRVRSWQVIPKADPDCQTEWAIVRSTIKSIIRLQEVD